MGSGSRELELTVVRRLVRGGHMLRGIQLSVERRLVQIPRDGGGKGVVER